VYQREDCVIFHKTRETFGGLSNMASGYPLQVAGVAIPSSEALYQACRFPHLPEVQRAIVQQSSPMTAKMKSKPFRKQSRDDWEEIKVAVMKWCLKVKLIQHWDRFSELLLSTATKPIVEQSRRDAYWGAILQAHGETLIGSNVLGRLLMDLRERSRKTPEEFSILLPLPLSNFVILGHPIGSIERNATHNEAALKRQKLRFA
jgi:N-glycosidase YbiA